MVKMIVGQYTIIVFGLERVNVWKNATGVKGYRYADYRVYDPNAVMRWNNAAVEALIERYELDKEQEEKANHWR